MVEQHWVVVVQHQMEMILQMLLVLVVAVMVPVDNLHHNQQMVVEQEHNQDNQTLGHLLTQEMLVELEQIQEVLKVEEAVVVPVEQVVLDLPMLVQVVMDYKHHLHLEIQKHLMVLQVQVAHTSGSLVVVEVETLVKLVALVVLVVVALVPIQVPITLIPYNMALKTPAVVAAVEVVRM
tara:strand:+ start:1400 stop:1936 length:537 start_codon:yes stop_codon:yes gene_type:complete